MSTILGNPITLGGGGLELVVNVDTGATVTATLGSKTVTGVSADGQIRLKIPEKGKWTVSAVKGLMVSVPQDINVPATLDIPLVAVAQELNDNSWEVIKQVADASRGANIWSVGDCKEVTLNGTVSDGLTLSDYSAWVYIIGFDHNAEREGTGITFQGFKATKNGTPVCLTDSGFNSNKTSGTWFNMNNSATNAGGWKASSMRTVIMPLIKASLPADLQAVIKTSTIYTAPGTGDIACTASDDDVFLLGEYEVFGTISSATTQEPNYLKQYTYYSAGNSKLKYKHNDTSTAAYWWERSPFNRLDNRFCSVTSDGDANSNTAYRSRGVAPCFKV